MICPCCAGDGEGTIEQLCDYCLESAFLDVECDCGW